MTTLCNRYIALEKKFIKDREEGSQDRLSFLCKVFVTLFLSLRNRSCLS